MIFWQNNWKGCQKFINIDHELRVLDVIEVVFGGRGNDGLAETRHPASHSALKA